MKCKLPSLSKMLFLILAGVVFWVFIPNNARASLFQDNKITVTGTVKDKDGVSLAGATIQEKGTNNATATDFDGKFTLTVSNQGVLIFSFIGLKGQEVKVDSRSIIDVVMEDDITSLQEVVVTGFQTVSKDKTTGSVQSLSGTVLKQRPTQSFLDKLEGMTPGVSATYSDGGVSTIEIRGKNTLLGNSNPLYVVDGFPLSGSLSTVNPEDIETMYVLSDAAATAQWGVQASNGVVVITTKKAAKGQTTIDFSTFYAVTERPDFDKMNWLSTKQEVALDQEYVDKGWYNFPQVLGQRFGINNVQMANIYKMGLSPDGSVWTDATFDSYINKLSKNDATKQWEELMFRKAISKTYNLSISSSQDRNSVYASLVYNDDKIREKGNDNSRIVFNIRDRFQVTDKIGFSASMNAAIRKQTYNGISVTSVSTQNAYDNIVDEYGDPIQYYRKYNPWVSRDKEAIKGFFPYSTNPLDERREKDIEQTNIDLRAQFSMDWQIIDGLKFETMYQYERNANTYDRYMSMDLPEQRILVNDMYIAGTNTYQIPVGTQYYNTRNWVNAFNWRNTLTYNKEIGVDHDISVLTGFDMRKLQDETMFNKVYGYNKQTTTYVPVDNYGLQGGTKFRWDGTRFYDSFFDLNNTDNRTIGFFVMPGYTYKGKYTVNANYRVDQKNLFGSDPRFRYKPLWSVGASWVANKEGFLTGVNWLNKLVVKTSYGITGNASNLYSPYAQANNYVSSWGANLYSYLRLTQPANPQLKWEETSTFNISTEFSVLNNRVSGLLSHYREKSTDLLGDRALDPTNGFNSAVVNYASLINKGVELMLKGTVLKMGDFTWDLTWNINYNKNEVTKVDDPNATPFSLAVGGAVQKGKPVSNLYSYHYAGLSQYGEVQLYDAEGNVKSWRSGVSSVDELKYWGTRTAPVYGGVSTSLTYKGFDLSINMVYKAGHYFTNPVYRGGNGTTQRMPELWAKRWMKPGDELTTRVPKIAYEGVNPYSGQVESFWDSYDSDLFWAYSQDNVYKANFLKVRDIILGYNFSNALIERAGLKSLRVTGQITNPYQWFANSPGVDPENLGAAAWINPKMFTLGVRASF